MSAGGRMHFPHLPDWLVYGAAVLALLVAASGRQGRIDAPPPPPPVTGEEALPLDPGLPFAQQQVARLPGRVRESVGTAFSVGDGGRWVTAAHVVQGCRQVALMVAEGRGVQARVAIDPAVDLAILTTEGGASALPLIETARLRDGQLGFHPGYPHGEAGEAMSRYLGRDRLPARRRGEAGQEVLAWTESGRTEDVPGSLAGLSGAPVLDANGLVVGVTLAEQPRRGRLYTTTPETLKASLAAANAVSTGAPLGEPVTAENYYRIADRLRRELRVAQVVCLAG